MLLRRACGRTPWLLAGAVAAGCAGTTANTPSGRAETANCTLLRVEQVERESDLDSDSTSLNVVFTPGGQQGAAAPGPELSLEVQVLRERADDVRANLEANPYVICNPDQSEPSGYKLDLSEQTGP